MVTKVKFDTVHMKAKSSMITIKLDEPIEVENTKEGKAIVAKAGWDQLNEYCRELITGSETKFKYCVE